MTYIKKPIYQNPVANFKKVHFGINVPNPINQLGSELYIDDIIIKNTPFNIKQIYN